MGQERALMVSGDMGGGRIHLPVYKELVELGIIPQVVTDASPGSKAGNVWEKAGIAHTPMLPSAEVEDVVRAADLIFVGSCASCYATVKFALDCGNRFNKLTVIGSDMWFNHARTPWIRATPDLWFAIDEVHQEDILRLRPGWLSDRVPILGQPVFDSLVQLITDKEKIRKDVRDRFGIADNEEVLLFWAPGDHRERCAESFVSLIEAIRVWKKVVASPVVIPRLHPKMAGVLGKDFDNEWREKIASACRENKCRVVNADGFEAQKLNLAADLVLSVWGTDSITSAICKVPTVNVFLEKFQNFVESNLRQTKPYLPTLKCGAAIGAFSVSEIETAMKYALSDSGQKEMARNAQKMRPSGDSARTIALYLEELLS